MVIDPADPGPDVLAFLTERHLATLPTLRPDGSPHVVPVGLTYDAATRTARVITSGTSAKAAHVRAGRPGRGARRRTALRPAIPAAAGEPAPRGHRDLGGPDAGQRITMTG